MNSQVEYSVVIPVYNGEQTIENLALGICHIFEQDIQKSFEIVFVDDYSKDGSWAKLKTLAKDKRIKAIRLTNNFGQHNATLCGMANCCGKYVITMDDDLQHCPEDIPKLMAKKAETKAKIVIARLIEKKHSWLRNKASDLMRKLNEKTVKKPKGIYLSSFRLLDREIVEGMLKIKSAFPYLPALMFFVTPNVVNVDVTHMERKHGSSNYTITKMIKLASNLMISNSSLLLRLVGRIGLTISTLSIFIGIYLMMKAFLLGNSFNGLTSLIVTILFVSGLQLMAMYVVGEYLIRILYEVNDRPKYIIDITENLEADK